MINSGIEVRNWKNVLLKVSSFLDTLHKPNFFLHFLAKKNLLLYTQRATSPFAPPQKNGLRCYPPSDYPDISEPVKGRVKMRPFQLKNACANTPNASILTQSFSMLLVRLFDWCIWWCIGTPQTESEIQYCTRYFLRNQSFQKKLGLSYGGIWNNWFDQ